MDNRELGQTIDSASAAGLVGVGSGWHGAQFDNLTVRCFGRQVDLALRKHATASSRWSPEYAADRAVDGTLGGRWNSKQGTSAGEWLEVDLGKPTAFNRTVLHQFYDRITKYRIQYQDGGGWRDAYSGDRMGLVRSDSFPTVTARRIRLFIDATGEAITPSIYGFEVYRIPDAPRRTPPP